METVTILGEVMPWVISLISVCVAIASVWMNKRMAYRQAFFDRKAQAYELFFETFSNLAFDQFNPAKRAALANAAYCAFLFSSREAAKGLNFVVGWAMSAKDYEDIAVLDEIMPELRDKISRDLSDTWTAPIRRLREDFAVSKTANSQGGSPDPK